MVLNTSGYDAAMADFLRHVVEAQMSASDRIYASIGRVPFPEGVASVRVEVGDARTTSPEVHMSELVSVERSDVLEGNLEEVHNAVAPIAEAYLEQFMIPFFEHAGEAAEAVGNSMALDSPRLGWDEVLDAWEKVELAVDAAGRVQPPQMVAGPEVADQFRDQVMTEAQQRRATELALRKQEDHVSRRRSRRLR